MQSWFLIKNIFSANILMRGFELSADILNKFLEIDYNLVLVYFHWRGKINFRSDIGFEFAMESEKLSFFIRNFYKWFITTLRTSKSMKFIKLHHFKEAFFIYIKNTNHTFWIPQSSLQIPFKLLTFQQEELPQH